MKIIAIVIFVVLTLCSELLCQSQDKTVLTEQEAQEEVTRLIHQEFGDDSLPSDDPNSLQYMPDFIFAKRIVSIFTKILGGEESLGSVSLLLKSFS